MKRNNNDKIDWNLCFICQKSNSKPARSTTDGLKSLSEKLLSFYKLDANSLHCDASLISTEIVDNVPNFHSTLVENGAVYHHNCTSRYKKREEDALKKRVDAKNADAATQNENKAPGSSGVSLGLQTNTSFEMGSRICCICANEDTDENLHAAGMYHALKSDPNHKHAQTLTEKLLEMAFGGGKPIFGEQSCLRKCRCK